MTKDKHVIEGYIQKWVPLNSILIEDGYEEIEMNYIFIFSTKKRAETYCKETNDKDKPKKIRITIQEC